MRGNESQRMFTWVAIALIAVAIPAPVAGQPRRAIQWGLDFSCDTSFVGTCGDHVRVYEVKSGKLLRSIAGRYTRTIAFSPVVPELFAAGGDDGILRLWRVGKKDFVREFRGHGGMIASVAFEKSGRYVASASVRYRKGKSDLGQFRLWDIKTGKSVQALDIKDSGIQGVSFSNDGKLVAFCRNQRDKPCHVDVYRVEPWKLVSSVRLWAEKELEITQFGKAVPLGTATRFEPDQKHVLIAGGICVRVDPRPYKFACRPTGLLWRADLTKAMSPKLLVKPGPGYYRSLGLSPDGKQFATGNGRLSKAEKPLIQMRNATDGKLLWSVASNVEPYGVTMSHDGALVGACQREGVLLVNAKTGETVRLIASEK